MGGNLSYEGKDRSTLQKISDPSPLRSLYMSKSDDIIYTGIKNFFSAANKALWTNATPDSYIRKTVGIQALFDVARNLMDAVVISKDIRTSQFEEKLMPASRIDFAGRFFQTSGTGRQRIRNCLELAVGLKNLDDIDRDHDDYRRLIV
jgi:hypothetical protein